MKLDPTIALNLKGAIPTFFITRNEKGEIV
jgi:hypothetical protein